MSHLGIDLGTTNSCMSVMEGSEAVVVLRLDIGADGRVFGAAIETSGGDAFDAAALNAAADYVFSPAVDAGVFYQAMLRGTGLGAMEADRAADTNHATARGAARLAAVQSA